MGKQDNGGSVGAKVQRVAFRGPVSLGVAGPLSWPCSLLSKAEQLPRRESTEDLAGSIVNRQPFVLVVQDESSSRVVDIAGEVMAADVEIVRSDYLSIVGNGKWILPTEISFEFKELGCRNRAYRALRITIGRSRFGVRYDNQRGNGSD
jgi:hypothetical protein